MQNSEPDNDLNRNTSGERRKNIIIYTPLVFGLIALLALRIQGGLDNMDLLAGALFLVALSCLIYAVMPGEGDISVQEELILQHIGLEYKPWMGRAANGAAGLLLVAIGALIILV